ncbi:serine hydrolase family protein [Candidatus Uhrbacteria bacterium]|nr:serine hydrolase family protein [Candidatus Uhrbacteria bacterium]
MKRVIIVHCWDGNPEYCWYPWLKRELEARGFEVIVPAMPETSMPKMDLWVPVLADVVGKPDKDTILVGHSIGCATIMRYLETLGETETIGGAVFIAGFTTDLGFEEIHNFFETPLDFKEIRSHLPRLISIHSNDDPFVDLKYATILADELGAETTILEKMKHFSGPVDNEESCVILSQALDAVMNMR